MTRSISQKVFKNLFFIVKFRFRFDFNNEFEIRIF